MNLDQLKANNQLKRPGMYDNNLFQNYQISFIYLEQCRRITQTGTPKGIEKWFELAGIQIIWIGVEFQLS